MDKSLLSSDSSNELVIDVMNFGKDQNNNLHGDHEQLDQGRFAKLNFGMENILSRVNDVKLSSNRSPNRAIEPKHSKRSSSRSSVALSPSHSSSSSSVSSSANSPTDSYHCGGRLGAPQQPSAAMPFDLLQLTATSESNLLPPTGRPAAGAVHPQTSQAASVNAFYQAYYASLGNQSSMNPNLASNWPLYDGSAHNFFGLHKVQPSSSMGLFSSLDGQYEQGKTVLPPIETYLNCYSNPYSSMYPYTHLMSAYMNSANSNGSSANHLSTGKLSTIGHQPSHAGKEVDGKSANSFQPTSTSASSTSANSAASQSCDKKKRSWSRAVFSNLQRKGLEKRFQVQKYITKPDRRQLAATLGLTDAQVKVWFQNRRMKWRHSKEYQDELPRINAMHQQELHTLMQKQNALVMHPAVGGAEAAVQTVARSGGEAFGQSIAVSAASCGALSAATPVIVRKMGDTVPCIKPLLNSKGQDLLSVK